MTVFSSLVLTALVSCRREDFPTVCYGKCFRVLWQYGANWLCFM